MAPRKSFFKGTSPTLETKTEDDIEIESSVEDSVLEKIEEINFDVGKEYSDEQLETASIDLAYHALDLEAPKQEETVEEVQEVKETKIEAKIQEKSVETKKETTLERIKRLKEEAKKNGLKKEVEQTQNESEEIDDVKEVNETDLSEETTSKVDEVLKALADAMNTSPKEPEADWSMSKQVPDYAMNPHFEVKKTASEFDMELKSNVGVSEMIIQANKKIKEDIVEESVMLVRVIKTNGVPKIEEVYLDINYNENVNIGKLNLEIEIPKKHL